MTSEPDVDRATEPSHPHRRAYFDTENYERAREVLRRSLAEHPNDPGLLGQHARAEYLLENYAGRCAERVRRLVRRAAG